MMKSLAYYRHGTEVTIESAPIHYLLENEMKVKDVEN
jgi:hypothetical protein